jgi:hypothetical protein
MRRGPSLAGLLVLMLVVGCSAGPVDDAGGTDTAPEHPGDGSDQYLDVTVSLPDELAVGDCVRLRQDRKNGLGVEPDDCADTGSQRVIAIVELDDDAYPGEGVLRDRSDAICSDAFEATGVSVGDGQPAYGSTMPTPGDWLRGERRVVCYADPPQ